MAAAAALDIGKLLADSMRQWQRDIPCYKPADWVFPSFELRGRKSRTGYIMAQNYLRPAAVEAGILAPDA